MNGAGGPGAVSVADDELDDDNLHTLQLVRSLKESFHESRHCSGQATKIDGRRVRTTGVDGRAVSVADDELDVDDLHEPQLMRLHRQFWPA